MIVSIMQPAYLPWLGYFERIALSDLHIILDDVQLERSSKTRFTNRNKIRTDQGSTWLTIPVKTAGLGQPLICQAEIDNEQNWRAKHWRSISQQYSRSKYFEDFRDELQVLYQQEWPLLTPLLLETTDWLRQRLGLTTHCVRSSELPVVGKKSELILELCRHARATKYISGVFGRDYLDMAAFEQAGIEVVFHDYLHPEYQQQFEGFEAYMSAIDLLFNQGSGSLDILMTNRKI
jgi:hypothetical protein